MIEYAIARLAALKSRFITAESLQRLLLAKDNRILSNALSESVFKEEMVSFRARGEGDPSPAAVLRLIHEGHARLRFFFSQLTKLAFPKTYEFILARWELEEIKASLRYLSSGGPTLERRFRFNSYFANAKETRTWGECKTVGEFLSVLAATGHPMKAFIDPELFKRDRVFAEEKMEQQFFIRYLPSHNDAASPLLNYFMDRKDAININTALLLRENPMDSQGIREWFLEGAGALSFGDFQALAKTPSLREAAELIKNRLRLSLASAAEDSPARFSTQLRKAFFHRYKRNKLLEPGGAWAFIFFREDLDAMVEDLKLALYFRSARVSLQDAEVHFITS